MVATGHFLAYEWLHWAYHQAPSGWLARVPLLGGLRRRHRLHHDPRQMTACKFNLTAPLMDLLCGTSRSSKGRTARE